MQNKLQELTDKLYNEGLSKGKQEAEQLKANAKNEAAQIIAQAKEQAQEILAKAQAEAAELKSKSENDVKMAAQQTFTTVKKQIENAIIAKSVAEPVKSATSDAEFLKGIIKDIVAAFNPGNSDSVALELILPAEKQKELDAYNVANNTNLSSKEYNDMKNMTVEDGIFYEVKSWFSKPQHKTGTTVSSANNRYQNQSVENQASESLGYGKLTDNHTGSGDHYTQGDSRWSNVNFGKMTNGTTTTIGTGGCGPTALANVYRNITGRTDVTPTTVANMAIDNGYTTNGGSNAGLFTEGAGKLGLATQRIGPNDLGNALSRGDSLILSGVKKGSGSPYTTSGHIISVKGMKNGKAIVQDPMKSSSTTMPLSNLTAGLNKAWAVTGANGYGNMSWDSSSNIGYGPLRFLGPETDEDGNTKIKFSLANAIHNKRYPVPLFFDDTLASGEQNYYYQCDPEWSGQSYGNSTIGKIGCLLSSMGMAMSAMTGGIDFSPGFLSKIYPAVDGGLGGNQAVEMGDLIGATYTRQSITSLDPSKPNSSYWEIIDKLKKGYPVILSSYTNGNSDDGSHHYLINGLHEGRISSANLEGDSDDAHWTMLFDPGSKYNVGAINLREMLANNPGRLSTDARILTGDRIYTTTLGPTNGKVSEFRWFNRTSDFTDFEGLSNTLASKIHSNPDAYDWIINSENRINKLSDTDRPWFDEDFDELNSNQIFNEVFSANLTDLEKNALNTYNGLPTSNPNTTDEGVMNANDGTSGMDKITGGFSQLFENIGKVAWNILDAILTGGDYKSIFSGDRFVATSGNSVSSSIDSLTNIATKDNTKYINFGKDKNGRPILVDATMTEGEILKSILSQDRLMYLDDYAKINPSPNDLMKITSDPNSNASKIYEAFAYAKLKEIYNHAVRHNIYYQKNGAKWVDSRFVGNYASSFPSYATTNAGYLDTMSTYNSSRMKKHPGLQDTLAGYTADLIALHESSIDPTNVDEVKKYFTAMNLADENRTTMGVGFFGVTGSEALERLANSGEVDITTANEARQWAKRMNQGLIYGKDLEKFNAFLRKDVVRPPLKKIQDAMVSQLTMQYVEKAGEYYDNGIINDPRSIILSADMNHVSPEADFFNNLPSFNNNTELATVYNNMIRRMDTWKAKYRSGWKNRITDSYNLLTSGASSQRPGYTKPLPPVIKNAIPDDVNINEGLGYGDLDKSLASYKMSSKVKRTVSAPTFKSSEKGSSGRFTSTKYTPRTASVHSGHSFHSGRSLGYGTAGSMFTSVDMTPMENKTDKLIYLLEKVVTNTAKAASNTSSSTNITNYNTNTTTRNEIAYGDVKQDSGSSNVVVVDRGNSNKINQNYKDKLRSIHDQIARSPRH